MASWRKSSRASRDTISRETRLTDMQQTNVDEACKLPKGCQNHVRWKPTAHDVVNGTKMSSLRGNGDKKSRLIESKMSNVGAAHV
ncbi:hypothetical protein ACF0H5_018426 [Mactra antiquata]